MKETNGPGRSHKIIAIQSFMIKYIFICIILICNSPAKSQGTQLSLKYSGPYEFLQLYQLDSIANSYSPGRYFGSLYFTFLQSIEKQLSSADSFSKHLVQKFERVFAQFYIDACNAHETHQPIIIREWEPYFSYPGLQPFQYKLLGANAHLNGGLWQALTNSFSQEEMKALRNEFVIFKKSLNQTYKGVYREAAASNKKVHALEKLSMGTSHWIGNYYLYKWRKRQMRLARLYWSASPGYSILLKKVERKKRKIDWLIIHTL